MWIIIYDNHYQLWIIWNVKAKDNDHEVGFIHFDKAVQGTFWDFFLYFIIQLYTVTNSLNYLRKHKKCVDKARIINSEEMLM